MTSCTHDPYKLHEVDALFDLPTETIALVLHEKRDRPVAAGRPSEELIQRDEFSQDAPFLASYDVFHIINEIAIVIDI